MSVTPDNATGQRNAPPAVTEPKSTTPASDKLDAIGIEAICEKIIDGKTTRQIASEAGVGIGTLFSWLEPKAHPERAERYARALAARGENMAERVMQEAEAAVGKDAAGVQAQRLIVDSLKWSAAHLAPKRWGEKIQTESTVKVEIDLTPRKDQLRQMLDITPAPLVIDNKGEAMPIRGRSALESIQERGLLHDGPVNRKPDVVTVEAVTVSARPERVTKPAAVTPAKPATPAPAPPEDRKPMTNAERQKAYRQRQAAAKKAG